MRGSKLVSTLTVVLFVSLLFLFLTTVFGISITRSSEAASIDKSNYQVIALADGQAYFGKIVGINSKNITLRDVYYLNNQSATEGQSAANIQLIKRGCEVHSPQDQMIIYREQVNFWENLKSDGRVAEAIAQWKEQNPEGQNCEGQTTIPTQQPGTTPSTESNNPAGGTAPAGSEGADTNDTPASNPREITNPNTPTTPSDPAE